MIRFYFLVLFLVSPTLSASDSEKWDRTIKKVTNSVVSIQFNAVRSFDTEGNKVSQATGFVVDAQRGIILTNRHVVTPGPVTAEAVFSNSEEVDLIAIYRDPVHDFGFYQYDPASLEFIKPQALKLVTDKAKIGDEIKVIGNDSTEHMSILSATLARLDRAAPNYGFARYSDFNTFYYQSAADTSGGSSGAPVVNIDAEVIALNAGANNHTASSFFLPLHKVTRALKALQNNQPINRGTLGATFTYQPYDQARRLGLTSELERKFRSKNNGNGLLTVQQTLNQSEASTQLRPGDILLSVKSKDKEIDFLTRFEELGIFLDDHVEQTIKLRLLRQGKEQSVSMTVTDLHSITPDSYMEISGSLLNNLSYQIARQVNLPVKGVYVSSPGTMFSKAGLRPGSIIRKINNNPVKDLTELRRALSKIRQGEYFKVDYLDVYTPTQRKVTSVRFETNWHPSKLCKRNDISGLWPCESLSWNQKVAEPVATTVKFPKRKNKKLNKIARSLVIVQANLPYLIDGQNFPDYTGTGLIVDAENGLVIADRNTVPVKMAQVSLTFAGVAEVPAEILFVHPLHSFVLLKFDPALIKGSNIRSAQLNSEPLEAGDSAWLIGYQTSNRLISEKVSVSSFDPLILPAPNSPQFRDTNINAITINNPPAVSSGVLLDKRGKVRSWWTNFPFGRSNKTIDRGLPIKYIEMLKSQWLENRKVELFSLEAEFIPMTIANAKKLGLPDSWIKKIQSKSDSPQLLQVRKRFAGSDSFKKLKEGDLLLTINNEMVNDFSALDTQLNSSSVDVSIWRDNKQIELQINTQKLSDTDTLEAITWAGALIQKPHRALATQHNIESSSGVYISRYWFGSPAQRHGLIARHRIVELEGEEVTDLHQFIALTQKFKDKRYIRARLVDLIGREKIVTLKQDLHYWPTLRVFQEDGHWKNQIIE